ncbi:MULTISPECIES: AMP-dependent synthetase/ligase [Aliivibrio]|uniref:Long-chain fatty acid--CoA ligase n=1 Tax=Aliivibrio finisterrensis TaxID=511998 RepID=A0A4Q5KVN5_9GAMM|nr:MULTISPECIES: long-chain fatty acid--CoA ligase [Aliivibrio]MDD9178260.1 long-chain fatty acid--CoA ligase [Aliivibrio sp. A6]RYU52625.1 long-chain fatty acid--CoA ligase [Aliivibrio finisterrensis]RYU55846.1 long-chain fatty acid--CoA ligase [Aliivibrio finisterrensis]RYU60686.1 long-chain fatty acid--CoA ligase [Aliivibrio finisterrensis]RYU66333.1 long-chain fatty acid--CoA ligase [Aliivibrio finisterrensis]
MTIQNPHIVKEIRQHIANKPNTTALRERKCSILIDTECEAWSDITWGQFGEQMDTLSLALLAHGLKVQEKVGIFSNNMPRWTVADFATMQLRSVPVPIYPTNTPTQAAYIINDADIRILFVGEQAQYNAAVVIFEQCPQLTHIVALSDDIDLNDHQAGISWNDFVSKADDIHKEELQARLDSAEMDDLLTLIYTSGTTGEPKGVMLDYINVGSQLEAHNTNLALTEKDVSLCFLPLSHVFERAWTFYVLYKGATNCYLPNTNLIKEALIEVKPTVMCAVPRFYEKIFSTVHEKVSRAPAHRKVMFTWAVNMGAKMSACQQEQREPSWLLKQSHKIADKLVLSKLRMILGGKINFMPCGGAKLDATIGRFFHALGVNVKLGYGMTETTATISCWEDGKFHPDSIGTLMPGAEVKIGESSEILVRGPMVMKGYYNKPEETESNFTEDGFLKTGDAGEFDAEGNLYITDRIKELMKTSGGKYIAPQVIEGAIGKDHFIEQIAVIADTRKFVSALIVPCYDALEEYAKELNIAYHDRMELIKHSEIVEMLEKRVANLQKELARFEQVKKFTLLSKEFSMDKGELTPTQKLRRKVINERYQDEIEEMYDEKKDQKGRKDKS